MKILNLYFIIFCITKKKHAVRMRIFYPLKAKKIQWHGQLNPSFDRF